jgi:hypothetical protein
MSSGIELDESREQILAECEALSMELLIKMATIQQLEFMGFLKYTGQLNAIQTPSRSPIPFSSP